MSAEGDMKPLQTPPQSGPTISMRWVKYDEESYGVELTVTGLRSEQQAEAALAYLQSLLAGPEIANN